jgi:nicotinamidase-related amidase
VIVGLASGFGVESTARAAYDLGYDVVLPADAIADPRPGAHQTAVEGIFRILGHVSTTDDVVASLG